MTMPEQRNSEPEGEQPIQTDRQEPGISQNVTASSGGTIQNVNQTVITGVNEKVVRRFGIEQRRGLILLAILLVVVVGSSTFFTISTLKAPKITQMSGVFNIAVADFVWKDNEIDLDLDLAGVTYDQLLLNLNELDPEVRPQVWGPTQVESAAGRVEGETSEDREASAAKIAQKIGADVILYGIIDTTTTPWVITPEFYLSDINLSDAYELTGSHAIGKSFSVHGSASEVVLRRGITRQLNLRAELLSKITIGIADYALFDYQNALANFRELETSDLWANIGGKEILYLLIGNAEGKLEQWEEAEIAYLQSLEINESYARAYIGLASLQYIQALEPIRQSDGSEEVRQLDVELMQEAIAQYGRALQATDRPELADVETKVNFGLGQAYTMLFVSGNTPTPDMAIAQLEAVIAEYDDGTNPRVQELAAEANARLGLIAYTTGSLEQAISRYELAADLSINPERRDLYQGIVENMRSQP